MSRKDWVKIGDYFVRRMTVAVCVGAKLGDKILLPGLQVGLQGSQLAQLHKDVQLSFQHPQSIAYEPVQSRRKMVLYHIMYPSPETAAKPGYGSTAEAEDVRVESDVGEDAKFINQKSLLYRTVPPPRHLYSYSLFLCCGAQTEEGR